jgi:peptide/nickel transport system substrate-binding protein
MLSRRTVLKGAAVGIAAVAGLSACSAGDTTSSAGGPKELVIGVLGEPTSWHSAQAHVGHLLQPYQLAYDSLLLRSPDGSLKPMLATEWKYTDEAQTTLQLKLRTDVTFSDGEKFDASAVKANLENFKKANGKQVAMLENFASAEVGDASTVTIKLAKADPAFEYYLSQAAGLMGSPKAITGTDIATTPVGSGPYTMVKAEAVKGSQYVFTKREGYWSTSLQKWDKITLKVLIDVTARVNALTTGQIDATLLDANTRSQAEAAGLTLLQWPVDWSGLLLFDRGGKVCPQLSDVRVRQAINYAIDRDSLVKNVAGGQATSTSQVFGPVSGSYIESLDKMYAFDPAKAKSLLAAAGYASGFDITIPMAPGDDVASNYIKQMLGDVGIRVAITAVPAADYQGTIGKGTYAMARFNLFQGPTWVACNQLIVPKTLYNPFQSTNTEIAGLLEATRSAGAQVGDKGKAVNQYVTENAWFAPFYRANQLYFYDPKKVKVAEQVQMAVPSIYNYEPVS